MPPCLKSVVGPLADDDTDKNNQRTCPLDVWRGLSAAGSPEFTSSPTLYYWHEWNGVESLPLASKIGAILALALSP
jgi:hypothetical protein